MALPAKVSALLASLESVDQAVKMSTGDKVYLKLAKGGYWAYGSDETEVEEGAQWAINPNAFAKGFACWGNGELLGEEMALSTETAVVQTDLDPIQGFAWKPQIGMQLACVSGEDSGLQAVYTATSVGGKKAFAKVLAEVIARIREGEDDYVPLVTLDVDSYKHKKYGKIYTPEMNITGWANPADATGKAPAPAEPVAEPEPVEEAPKRRSRKRAA